VAGDKFNGGLHSSPGERVLLDSFSLLCRLPNSSDSDALSGTSAQLLLHVAESVRRDLSELTYRTVSFRFCSMTRGSSSRPSSFSQLAAGANDGENAESELAAAPGAEPLDEVPKERDDDSLVDRVAGLEALLRDALANGQLRPAGAQNLHAEQAEQGAGGAGAGGLARGGDGGGAVSHDVADGGRSLDHAGHAGRGVDGAPFTEEPIDLDEDGERAGAGEGDGARGVDVEGGDAGEVAADAASRFGVLFGGHELYCEHDVQGNPFPRVAMLRARTSHYAPDAAGDTINAKVYSKLGQAGQKEMCTLVPLASYLWDAAVYGDDLLDAVPASLRPALKRLVLQLGACLSFTQERLDELEALSVDKLRASSFDPLYNNERSQSGARSLLGQTLHDSHVQRRHTRISATAAAEEVRALTGTGGGTPRGRGGGARSHETR
jgi:hypothetical protein